MLVLSRHANEEITIGNNIVVKVLQLGGGRVQLALAITGNDPDLLLSFAVLDP